MKQNFPHKGGLTITWPVKLLVVLLCLVLYTPVNAGNKGTKGDIKSIKVQLDRAQTAYQKNMQKKILADSLMNLGNAIHVKSGDEIKAAIQTMNLKAKAFTHQIKELEKEIKGSSASKISETREAIKALETDYKEALKQFDEIMKEQIKLADDGSRHIYKGKAFRREVKKSLRYSEKSLKQAKEAMETQTLLSSK